MPRPNIGRHVGSEEIAAQRIQQEREARGWTLESIARRMRDVGCPINTSAIHKIESGNPRRKPTVDDLVALSIVFDISVENLISNSELLSARLRHLSSRLMAALDEESRALEAFPRIQREVSDTHAALAKWVGTDPGADAIAASNLVAARSPEFGRWLYQFSKVLEQMPETEVTSEQR